MNIDYDLHFGPEDVTGGPACEFAFGWTVSVLMCEDRSNVMRCNIENPASADDLTCSSCLHCVCFVLVIVWRLWLTLPLFYVQKRHGTKEHGHI